MKIKDPPDWIIVRVQRSGTFYEWYGLNRKTQEKTDCFVNQNYVEEAIKLGHYSKPGV